MRELMHLADRLGASRVATGHYVRVAESERGLDLYRARDLAKDQSYFLHMLQDAVLRRLVFPLGDLDKPAVRAEALRLGLPGAAKGESQELCFVPTGRYDELVELRAKDRVRPGPILGPDGSVVGEHAGVHRFTVGQRRNLGVAVGSRAYVVDIDVESGAVKLGERAELAAGEALVGELSLRDRVNLPFSCDVAVRYRGRTVRAEVVAAPDEAKDGATSRALVRFAEPVHAVVPGQFAVFYDGDRVLGGGVIQKALSMSGASTGVPAATASESTGSLA
jgi:tRNA-specific 2-thiouridylase